MTPFPRQLAPFAALSFAAVLGTGFFLVERYSTPELGALAVFSVLAVFSFNRVVRLPRQRRPVRPAPPTTESSGTTPEAHRFTREG